MTKREAELREQGWQRRFIAAEPRLSEMAALYEQTGFEVHLEPLSAVETPKKNGSEGCEECMICFQGYADRYQVLYTRGKKQGKRIRKSGDKKGKKSEAL